MSLRSPGRQHDDRHQRQHGHRVYGLYQRALQQRGLQVRPPPRSPSGQDQGQPAPGQPGRRCCCHGGYLPCTHTHASHTHATHTCPVLTHLHPSSSSSSSSSCPLPPPSPPPLPTSGSSSCDASITKETNAGEGCWCCRHVPHRSVSIPARLGQHALPTAGLHTLR